MKRAVQLQFIRFALVGAGFGIGYALLTAFLVSQLGFPGFSTAVVLYALCIPMAYMVQRCVTFGAQDTHKGSFPIYAGTQVLSLVAVASLTARFVAEGFWTNTALYLITAGGAAVISYSVNRSLAFRTPASG